MRRLSNLLIAASLVLTAAQAQHVHPAGTEKPVALYAELGNYTRPIATRNAEAQKYFDQGLKLLYGFNRYEALRSFRKASELDPAAVMPYVGMAMAQGPHINMDLDGDYNAKESCESVAKAVALKAAPENERWWATALAKRCPEYKPAEYVQGMRELAAKYPDDLDALTLYAESLMIPPRWKWWNADGTPADGMADAVRTLEQVMRRKTEHPGANHFYIHAVEMSPSPERAIPSAQRLMGIVPGAGHLVHMPGHIWLLLGEWELAAAVNERAAQVDEAYFGVSNVTSSSYSGYYAHNLQFVAYARQMQGRKSDALAAAKKLVEMAKPMIETMPMMIDGVAELPMFAALRFGDWDAVLAEPEPNAKLLSSVAMRRYGRAIALAAKGRRAEALKERAAFVEAQKKVPAEWMWITNKASDVLRVAGLVMDARLAETPQAAVAPLREAIQIQDGLVYDEPPAWYYPVRESLGGALLRAGRAAEAEEVFRDGLRRSPKNGRMVFGLWESLKSQGKTAAAEMVRREFEEVWKRADVKLTVGQL